MTIRIMTTIRLQATTKTTQLRQCWRASANAVETKDIAEPTVFYIESG